MHSYIGLARDHAPRLHATNHDEILVGKIWLAHVSGVEDTQGGQPM